MGKRIFCAALGLFLLFSASAQGVRVHVIGETDLAEDQAFKWLVRDVLLAELEEFQGIEALEEKLNEYALARGHAANIRAEAGVFRFPDQELDGVIVPGGEYAALRVRIGKAEGRNWWSLLNPSPAACDTEDAACYSALIEWLLSLWDE